MSPLTKIFVVLLVVVSLLQTAGTVVFINRARPLQTALDDQKKLSETYRAQTLSAQKDLLSAKEQGAQIQAQTQGTIAAQQAVVAGMQTQIAQLNVQIATLNADKAARDGQIATLTQQLTWATAAETKLQDNVKTLRETNDKLVKQQEDDSRKIAELTSLSETLKAQLENATEQLAGAQNMNDKYKAYIKDHGLPPMEATFTPTGPGAPAISGLVVEKKMMNGDTYVTINVGSADNVVKGLEFSVLDAQGNFLGFVDVTSVDNNFSLAKAKGTPDKIGQIAPNDIVKTQIRS